MIKKLLVALILLSFISLPCFAKLSDKEEKLLKKLYLTQPWGRTNFIAEQVVAEEQGTGKHSITPGSTQEDAFIEYIVSNLKKNGISTSIEAFPIVRYEAKSCNMQIGKKTVQTVVYGNSIGTHGKIDGKEYKYGNTPDGLAILAEVVNVGTGRVKDFERLEGDVKNRVLLVKREEENISWLSVIIGEAKRRMAKAVIFQGYAKKGYIPAAIKQASVYSDMPVFGVSYNDGNKINQEVAGGIKKIMIKAEVDIYTKKEFGKNVVAFIRGHDNPDKYIAFGTHFDRWFKGTLDSASGVSTLLEIARYFKKSVRPRYGVAIIFFGASKGGIPSFVPNRLNGSFDFVHKHFELKDNLIIFISTDGIASRGRDGIIESSPELLPFIKKVGLELGVDKFYAYKGGLSHINDVWPFNKVYGASFLQPRTTLKDYSAIETNYDTSKEVSKIKLTRELQILTLAALRINNAPLLPFSLSKLASYILEALNRNSNLVPVGNFRETINAAMKFHSSLIKFEKYINAIRRDIELNLIKKNLLRDRTKEKAFVSYNDFLIKLRNSINRTIYTLGGDPGKFKAQFLVDQICHDMNKINLARKSITISDNEAVLKNLTAITGLTWGQFFSKPVFNFYMDSLKNVDPNNKWVQIKSPYVSKELYLVFENIKSKKPKQGEGYKFEIDLLNEEYDRLLEILNKDLNTLTKQLKELDIEVWDFIKEKKLS